MGVRGAASGDVDEAEGDVELAPAVTFRTKRLELIAATTEALRAELESREALGRVLNVAVPSSWPPELYDADAVRWVLNAMEAEGGVPSPWGLYYIADAPREGSLAKLIGVGGYKGPPDAAGIVELGYGVVPERRRAGYATEATRGMVERAFDHPGVQTVVAHTLIGLVASIGVLEKNGFRFAGPGNDPSEPMAIRYELRRAEWVSARSVRPSSP